MIIIIIILLYRAVTNAYFVFENHVWAHTCVDTNVSGHKRFWAQTCLGTIESGHKHGQQTYTFSLKSAASDTDL